MKRSTWRLRFPYERVRACCGLGWTRRRKVMDYSNTTAALRCGPDTLHVPPADFSCPRILLTFGSGCCVCENAQATRERRSSPRYEVEETGCPYVRLFVCWLVGSFPVSLYKIWYLQQVSCRVRAARGDGMDMTCCRAQQGGQDGGESRKREKAWMNAPQHRWNHWAAGLRCCNLTCFRSNSYRNKSCSDPRSSMRQAKKYEHLSSRRNVCNGRLFYCPHPPRPPLYIATSWASSPTRPPDVSRRTLARVPPCTHM